jgi:hypothetical protein
MLDGSTEWVTIGSTTVAALVVVIGWGVTSYFASRLARRNTQEAQKLAYLIEAYDALALSSNRDMAPDVGRMLETAVARIQLFGTPEEVQAVHNLVDDLINPKPDGTQSGSTDKLLFLLRNSLRKELHLPTIGSNILWLRVYDQRSTGPLPAGAPSSSP